MEEEYLKGMYILHNFLKDNGIVCKENDGCGECKKFHEFYNKHYEELNKQIEKLMR